MERKKKRKIKYIYIKIIILVFAVIITAYLIKTVTAKYKTTASSTADVDLAYYIFKEQSISQELKLQSILPRSTPYLYTFSVANNYEGERTQTALEYTIEITTTTNLQLQFNVHKQGQNTNLITGITTTQDSDQTYFKHITVAGDEFGFTQDQQNIYVLEVTFPTIYNEAEYEGIIEYVQLTINSKQKISAASV